MDFEIVEPKEPSPAKRFYRYLDNPYSEYPWNGPPDLQEYVLVKETPCGYWIIEDYMERYAESDIAKRYWVSKTGTKRRAYPTKEEAALSYLKRKEKQVKILTERLADAKGYLQQAMKLNAPKETAA